MENQEKEDNDLLVLPVPSNSQDSQDDSPDTEPDESAPCSTDAGHPRFTRGSRAAEAALRKQEEESLQRKAYCRECDVYLLNSELPTHFHGHQYSEKCVYCEKPAYQYIWKGEDHEPDCVRVYHRCPQSDDVPSVATPAGNDMNCNEINSEPNE